MSESYESIRYPKQYKIQKDPPKPKAVIKSSLSGLKVYEGEVMDKSKEEEKKRKKHEYYLRSKEKKMAAMDKAQEEKKPKAAEAESAPDIDCTMCIHFDVCRYKEQVKTLTVNVPENIKLTCRYEKT